MNARFRLITGLFTVANLVLVLMLCGMAVRLREDVNQLKTVLATKDDLINVSVPRMKFFHEEKCTTCHSERRFMGPHENLRGHLDQAVMQMMSQAGADISEDDFVKLHGSLVLERCRQCHGEEQLRKLAIKSPEQRMQIIREMIAKPGSDITPDEAEEINRSFEQMLGF
jgi:hypothetical protein